MKLNITRETPVLRTGRALQLEGLFEERAVLVGVTETGFECGQIRFPVHSFFSRGSSSMPGVRTGSIVSKRRLYRIAPGHVHGLKMLAVSSIEKNRKRYVDWHHHF